jgi:hypothetical protein
MAMEGNGDGEGEPGADTGPLPGTRPGTRWLLRLAGLLVAVAGMVMLVILYQARTFDPVEHGALPVPESEILWAVTPDAGGDAAGPVEPRQPPP